MFQQNLKFDSQEDNPKDAEPAKADKTVSTKNASEQAKPVETNKPITEKHYLTVYINFSENAFPEISDGSLHAMRWAIRDTIEERGIAEVIGSGTGCGRMDIGMEVTNVELAKSQIREIAREFRFQNVEFSVSSP